PLPNTLEESLAPDRAAVRLVLFHQQAFDHHLRGNARMIRARLPQYIAPSHALKSAENVLNGIVERMPHVERACHIGRRNDDSKRLRFGSTARLEKAAGFPLLIEAGFNFRWGKGLLKHKRESLVAVSGAINTTAPSLAT